MSEMKDVVIVSMARTATGKFGGSLRDVPAPVHGAECVKAMVQRTGIDPHEIDEVIIGTHFQAGIKANSARQCALYAGLPDTTPAFTPNKNCATAMKAMQCAAQSIQAVSYTHLDVYKRQPPPWPMANCIPVFRMVPSTVRKSILPPSIPKSTMRC